MVSAATEAIMFEAWIEEGDADGNNQRRYKPKA